MAESLTSAPVLSTPDHHILTETETIHIPSSLSFLSEDDFRVRYEIDRTLSEIRQHRWRRVALQFPDHMLSHSARVFQLLSRGLSATPALTQKPAVPQAHELDEQIKRLDINNETESQPAKFTILADTSYGSCCIDEIAAEHVNADAVVHYGRACLSPTARLPVLHVYTSMPLGHDAAIQAFTSAYHDRTTCVIITGDIPYAEHVQPLATSLANTGYTNIFAAQIIHNHSSAIPNRTLPGEVEADPEKLSNWHVFHIAEPPTALLLTLSSRVASIRIYDPESPITSVPSPQVTEANTSILLRRRYALVTSMNTVSTWGILINTLSVKNYLHVVEHVKQQIAAAGKKSYLFVVGKINAAKVANFSEIGGWVVIGCWESSLIDSKEFYRPILTPFELELTLASDDRRVWTGTWSSDFQELLNRAAMTTAPADSAIHEDNDNEEPNSKNDELALDSSDEESAPPEFDLRTGRYVSQSRPMRHHNHTSQTQRPESTAASGVVSNALTRRANGDIIAVNGIASPAAEYLKEKRTWKGLGSDFEIRYEEDGAEDIEGGLIEEGRTGVAGGYIVGDSVKT
ncbi:Diphthamide biosynthesis protein 2 [Neophaeococcomyces mojaviensis]|uniref:Diphthamide biosynthesis protein 2 n=1 Tax=Neophaeococcomyces mojaviensis TaxID=3383035 RepID=A0ACC2ZWN2_9EURO|nr:Diphthamide biosynthesis protein 2 [Knufia sp. JES_112]